MDVETVKELCSAYPGASSKLYGPPSNVLVYYVGGKKFAYFTSEPEQWRFSFRTSAERFLELTDVPGFKPARYIARFHWVTVVNVAAVLDAELRELITSSYERVRSVGQRVVGPASVGHGLTIRPSRRRFAARLNSGVRRQDHDQSH